jgi:hypothetical protein
MNTLDMIENQQLRTDIPAFKPGDTIKFIKSRKAIGRIGCSKASALP